MRISDWSSDVCSSDLRDAQAVVAFAELARAARIVEMVFADEGRHRFGIEQLFGQAIDRPPLEIRLVDRPVVRAHRRAALAKAAASPAVLADDRVAVASDAAPEKLRQQFRSEETPVGKE